MARDMSGVWGACVKNVCVGVEVFVNVRRVCVVYTSSRKSLVITKSYVQMLAVLGITLLLPPLFSQFSYFSSSVCVVSSPFSLSPLDANIAPLDTHTCRACHSTLSRATERSGKRGYYRRPWPALRGGRVEQRSHGGQGD